MIDKLVRFSRDTHCFERSPMGSGFFDFTVAAGSLGIVVCKTQCLGRTQDYRTSYEILVDGKIVYEIDPRSLIILKEGECL